MEDFGMLVADVLYSDMFKRVALNFTKNHHDANDLIQETALKAWSNRDKFKDGNIAGWLYTILKMTHINNRVKHGRHGVVFTDKIEYIPTAIIEPEIYAEMEAESLKKAILNLQVKHARLFTMRLQGYNNLEISESEQVPEGTIKSRWSEGMKILKKVYRSTEVSVHAGWKNVVGYEGLYKVSRSGLIYSLSRKKLIKPFFNRGWAVVLFQDTKPKNMRVHKIVEQAYGRTFINQNQV